MTSRRRVLELSELADNELIEVDNFLLQQRKLNLPAMPAIPTTAEDTITVNSVDTELMPAAHWAVFERSRDHVPRAELSYLAHGIPNASFALGGTRGRSPRLRCARLNALPEF